MGFNSGFKGLIIALRSYPDAPQNYSRHITFSTKLVQISTGSFCCYKIIIAFGSQKY